MTFSGVVIRRADFRNVVRTTHYRQVELRPCSRPCSVMHFDGVTTHDGPVAVFLNSAPIVRSPGRYALPYDCTDPKYSMSMQ